jgi:hypothetical protein
MGQVNERPATARKCSKQQKSTKSTTVVRSLDVYNGRDRAGGIKVKSDGEFVAYDANNRKIGSFRTLQDATAATSKYTKRDQQ